MSLIKILPVLGLVLSLAPNVASAGFPGFQPVQPVEPLAETFHVVFNGHICFTDPCPSFTAVGQDGEKLAIAGLDAADGVFLPHVGVGAGLKVTGSVVPGSWEPGEAGDVLLVQSVEESAGLFTVFPSGIVCIMAPCPSLTAAGVHGDTNNISGFDLSLLENGSVTPEDFATIHAGGAVVSGFVIEGEFPSDTKLMLTGVAGQSDTYMVAGTGIVCNKAPCPMFEALSDESNEISTVHEVNLSALQLSLSEAGELMSTLFTGGDLLVKGTLVPEHIAPQFGTVLFVTGLIVE